MARDSYSLDSCPTRFDEVQCYRCHRIVFLHELYIHKHVVAWKIHCSLFLLCLAICNGSWVQKD